MRISCSEFRKYLDAYFDVELAEPERAEFDAHVAVCGECRKHYADQAWFRAAVRPALKRPCALSDAARTRLRASLSDAGRQMRRRVLLRRVAPAVSALAAVGALFMLVTPLAGFTPMLDDVVQHHVERTPVDVPTPEADELEGWFKGRLPFRFNAPRFRDGAMLLGGRLTRVAGPELAHRQAAWLVYGVGRHKLSVLVFDAGDLDVTGGGRVETVKGHDLSMHDSRGFKVALFRQGDIAYAVTSDLPEDRMVQLIGTAF